MLKAIINFYNPQKELKLKEYNSREYINKRWGVFAAAILGYSIYYVCRLSFSIVKKPIIDAHIFSESEVGIIGSALFFSYAIGKMVNGFIADRVNIRKFFATGLLASAVICSALGFTQNFVLFTFLWGLLGWFQSMGAAPCAVVISRWYNNAQRGTYYSLWSASHSLGKAITYWIIAFAVASFGWQWGFWSASIIGFVGVIIILLLMYDSPQSRGFAPIIQTVQQKTVGSFQKEVFKNKAVWILAFASALMYISRYALESWGVFYLETEKQYSNLQASSILSISAITGIFGTIVSGFVSDKFFKGSRNVPALIAGVLNIISLIIFLFFPKNMFLDSLSMAISGFAMGILITFVGGLMAVDIVPKQATGAALGLIGISSYIGAGLQDIISGYFIQKGKTTSLIGKVNYDFSQVAYLWLGAAIISVILVLFVWNSKTNE
ncbi:MAG: MFS transporter [Ferruginibacter sp.]|nr:MFS transporter [Ferruginibacter sp.]